MQMAAAGKNAWREEWPLPVALVILVVGWYLKPAFATNGSGNFAIAIAFAAFFIGALLAAILATRHAEHLAERFGEPYGTLMLTLSAISLEIATVVTVMLHNADNPAFGRDTMFAVVMIVLNGIIGIALLVGGPDGLAPACLARAEQRRSLSRLTLPHMLVRVVVAEQLYRAWTLLQGHPYHRGAVE